MKSNFGDDVTFCVKKRLDEKGFETNEGDVGFLVSSIKQAGIELKLLNLRKFGYLDLAMLGACYPDAKLCSFGAGTAGQAHSPDEYVILKDLYTAKAVYKNLIAKTCA